MLRGAFRYGQAIAGQVHKRDEAIPGRTMAAPLDRLLHHAHIAPIAGEATSSSTSSRPAPSMASAPARLREKVMKRVNIQRVLVMEVYQF